MTPHEGRLRDAATLFLLALILAGMAWLAGFVAALYVAPASPAVPQGVEAPPNWDLFGEVWGYVDREFYGARPDGQALTHRAIDGLVESIADPYADYTADGDQSQPGSELLPVLVEGTGAWMEQVSGGALVLSVLSGSPAEAAGLKPGDKILAAGDTALAGLESREVVEILAGEPGTDVALLVRAPDGTARATQLDREAVAVPAVQTDLAADAVAVVHLPSLTPEVVAPLDDALASLATSDLDGFVLDLRDNAGGDLETLRAVAARFIDGVVWSEIGPGGEETEQRTPDSAVPAYRLPSRIVVLVNGGTAGTAEILAGALQAGLAAQLVGEPTFGKSTIQDVRPLSDGSSLRLTVGSWQTPDGKSVESTGLVPDRRVDGRSDQFEAALDTLAVLPGG